MVWKELIPKIEFLLRRHPPPKFVVIQLGSNDLGTVKGWQLAENIICDILRMCAVVTITIYFSGTKATVPYGAPSQGGCVAVSRAYPTYLAGYGKMKTGHVGPHILRELIF
jgi:hypothetical protein